MTASPAIPIAHPRVAKSVDARPGLDQRRLARLMAASVERLGLDLSGCSVVTEAATGAYSVTPVIAALAGAQRIQALTRTTRFGSTDEVIACTNTLAATAGVEQRIEIVTSKDDLDLADADVVTNSGHLRPLDASTIRQMRPGAAIPLMYEAWELRPGDVDLGACRERGIRVAGTNERHPAVDVFSFLGLMAVKLLTDAGVAVHCSRLLLLCDNPFAPFIERTLTGVGATVLVRERFAGAPLGADWDAVVVALRPRDRPVLTAADARTLAHEAPGTIVAQYWGDIDRSALRASGVPVWPDAQPAAGHMAILPSGVGPEAIVRLQAAGLKVGEVLCQDPRQVARTDLDYIDWV